MVKKKELFWYEVTDRFYNIDDLDNVVELRRGGYKEDKNGNIIGEGGLFLVCKSRADKYYKEIGLRYIGNEVVIYEGCDKYVRANM